MYYQDIPWLLFIHGSFCSLLYLFTTPCPAHEHLQCTYHEKQADNPNKRTWSQTSSITPTVLQTVSEAIASAPAKHMSSINQMQEE